ncbi:MAG: hypothetical protein J7L08_04040, partial [Candidatus Aenigmarchaeota archaeon]|nr:hypothetical protein [Candidatus Aenigmarchaeota archaeon]
MDVKDKIKALYNHLKEDKKIGVKNIGTYDVFRENLKDETKRGKLYQNLIKANLTPDEIGDSTTFSNIIEQSLRQDDIQKDIEKTLKERPTIAPQKATTLQEDIEKQYPIAPFPFNTENEEKKQRYTSDEIKAMTPELSENISKQLYNAKFGEDMQAPELSDEEVAKQNFIPEEYGKEPDIINNEIGLLQPQKEEKQTLADKILIDGVKPFKIDVQEYLNTLQNAGDEKYNELKRRISNNTISKEEEFNEIITPAIVQKSNQLIEDVDILSERYNDFQKQNQEQINQFNTVFENLKTLKDKALKTKSKEDIEKYNTEYNKQKPNIERYKTLIEGADDIAKQVEEKQKLLAKRKKDYMKMVVGIGAKVKGNIGIADVPTSWVLGSGKTLIEGFANTLNTLDRLGKDLADITETGDFFLQPGWRDESRTGALGDLAKFMKREVEGVPNLPNTIHAQILKGGLNLIPFMVEMSVAPEVTLPEIAGIAYTIPSIATLFGTKSLINSYADAISDEKVTANELEKSFGDLGMSMGDGLIMHSIGVKSNELGKFAKKIISDSPIAIRNMSDVQINKIANIGENITKGAVGGGGFGLLDAYNQFVRTGGKITNWESIYASIGFGAAFTVADVTTKFADNVKNEIVRRTLSTDRNTYRHLRGINSIHSVSKKLEFIEKELKRYDKKNLTKREIEERNGLMVNHRIITEIQKTLLGKRLVFHNVNKL